MNYQKINLNNKEFIIDLDARKVRCNQCGDSMRFAQDLAGKYYPFNITGTGFHQCSGITKTELEKNIENEERNQELLNNL